jgi:polo-like kinase 1
MKKVPPPPVTLVHKLESGSTLSYKREEEIGKGGFATVYRASDCETKQVYALKAVSKETMGSQLNKLYQEISIHGSCKHPNICRLYDSFGDANYEYMFLEMCPRGSLETLNKKVKMVPEEDVSRYVGDMIEGLAYLHAHNIVHRDVKLGNFLFDANERMKIADFGFSYRLEDTESAGSICGTPNYLSPELLIQGPKANGFKADVWAFGIVVFTLLNGYTPFESVSASHTFERIQSGNYYWNHSASISATAKDFVSLLLTADPNKRPSIADLRDHPFVTKPLPFVSTTLKQEAPVEEKKTECEENPCVTPGQVPMVPITPGQGGLMSYKAFFPKYCISKFVDQSNKFGVGYLLYNGCVGVLFKDKTRMIQDPTESFIQYYSSAKECTPLVIKSDATEPAKKLGVMKMLSKAFKASAERFDAGSMKFEKEQAMVNVKDCSMESGSVLFRYSNDDIQMNFEDKKKLFLFADSKRFLVNESITGEGIAYDIENIKNEALVDAKRRIFAGKKLLNKLAAE